MKINPFEIGKMVNKALKNKSIYEERAKELKDKPIVGTDSENSIKAHFDIEKHRIKEIEFLKDSPTPKNICEAINDAFDKADNIWKDPNSGHWV